MKSLQVKVDEERNHVLNHATKSNRKLVNIRARMCVDPVQN